MHRISLLIRLCGAAALFMALLLAGSVQAQLGGGHQVQRIEGFLATDAAHAGTTVHAAVQAQLKKRFHVNSNTPLDEFLIPTVLTIEAPAGITVQELAYPEPIHVKTGGSPTPMAVYEEVFAIGVALGLSADLAEGEYVVKARLRYQACDEKACFAPKTIETEIRFAVVPSGQALKAVHAEVFESIAFTGAGASGEPEPASVEGDPEDPAATGTEGSEGDDESVLALLDEFTVQASNGGYLKASEFIAFIEAAETGVEQRGWFEGKGPLAILALILVGGLALNLTPCVLPMVPINLAIIGAGAQAGSRARGFALGGTYGLAMATVYGVLGLVVILTAGTFGTINSYWWFNLGIAVLFVVLALAMFDVIIIDFSKFQAKFSAGGKGKGTFMLAFIMGSIAALLAGACVAPVVIQVIVFSSDLYAQGTTLALLLPFCLGLGMALPWPFAGGGLSFLPKPGAWMVRVKQVFGVFILAFAAYYGWQAYTIASANWVDDAAVADSVEALLEEGWYASLSEGLEAAKAEDKPVLVDMWATWCKNCLTMDKTTFKDEAVLARLEDYVKIKFQAQDPEASPAKEVMARFKGIGLPTYAILRHGGPQ